MKNTVRLYVIMMLMLLYPLFTQLDAAFQQVRSNRFSSQLSLKDIDRWYYDAADYHANEGRWDKAKLLLKDIIITKPSAIHQKDIGWRPDSTLLKAQRLYIKSLFALNRYEELMEYVATLDQVTIIELFNEIVDYYILSAVELNEYDELSSVLRIQQKYNPHLTNELYRDILYSLIVSKNYEPVIDLIDIFPSDIYTDGEKNYILGVVHFHLGLYSIAKGFFYNIGHESKFKQPAQNYVSMLYYLLDESENIPDDIAGYSDEVKFNFALTFLKAGMIDQANAIALTIEIKEKKQLLDIFVALETGHHRTALSLLNNFDGDSLSNYALTTLIMAEVSFFTGRYRDAEYLFKLYNSFDEADTNYVNHSLGHCFKEFYRYNSSAYYWIKNLDEGKSQYDSLAAYNLSLLYTQTENYASAEKYFSYYIDKYGLPESDASFTTAYLKTLEAREKLGRYRSIFEEYHDLLKSQDKQEGLLLLGEYFAQIEAYDQALYYYEEALSNQYDDDLILKIERIYFHQGKYNDSEEFIVSLIEKYPESSFTNKLSLDLAKFYISQSRYATAEAFIDSLLTANQQLAPNFMYKAVKYNIINQMWEFGEWVQHSGMDIYESKDLDEKKAFVDSLSYFQAVVLQEAGDTDKALEHFIELNRSTNNQGLRDLVFQHMKALFTKMKPAEAINYLNDLIQDEASFSISNQYMLLLAEIYEKESLFVEANKIYAILIEENPENTDLYHQLAINEIRSRNYQKALDYLNIIEQTDAEVTEDVLFLSYLAYYSLDEKQEAVEILLDLYYEYPDSPKRFEITKNIIELFIDNDYQLYAWYFLKDYYQNATQSEKWTLDRYREQMSSIADADTLEVEMITDLREVIPDSLFYPKEDDREN